MSYSPDLLRNENAGLNAVFYTKETVSIVDGEEVKKENEYIKITRSIDGKVQFEGRAKDHHKRAYYIEYKNFQGDSDYDDAIVLDLKNLNLDGQTKQILSTRHIKNIKQLAAVRPEDAHRLGTNGSVLIKEAKEYMEKLKLQVQVTEILQKMNIQLDGKDKEIEELKKRIANLEGQSKAKKG